MTPEKINLAIARQIALRRRELRMSLSDVAERCGVTLQQVHKYETGRSAVSAAMLIQLARCLDVPVAWFFQPLAGTGAPAAAPASLDDAACP